MREAAGTRELAGSRRTAGVKAARGAPAGAEPIVQPAPMSKLHLNRLSSRRLLSKWGFERLRSPGSAVERTELGFAGRPCRPGSHVPASAALACVYSENKRKTLVGVRVHGFHPFIYRGNVPTPGVLTGHCGMNGLCLK